MTQKNPTQTASEYLRECRLAKGYTQKYVADQLDLKYYSFLSQMENGNSPIPINLYGELARVLGDDRQEFVLTLLQKANPQLYAAMFGPRRVKDVVKKLKEK